MEKRKSYLEKKVILYCLMVAFAVITLCSRSSFLYAFNNWDDANSYFSMGKSIFYGVVPYRDLFDQKGILLYLLYGLASLISYRSFLGVYILEIIAAWGAAVSVYGLLSLYVRQSLAAVMVPISIVCIYVSRSFWWGGSAEEFMLPVLLCGLYLLLAHFHEENEKRQKLLDGKSGVRHLCLIGGVLAGAVLHIKFNSLGFYFGWIMVLLIAELGKSRKDHRFGYHFGQMLLLGIWFLTGMLLITVPFLIYFGIHGAIGDWFEVYIYDNLFIYSEKLSLYERMYKVAKTLLFQAEDNAIWSILAIFGVVGFCFLQKTRDGKLISAGEKVSVTSTAFFLLLGIFIGGVNLPYYSLPLSIYNVFGFILVGQFADLLFAKIGTKGRYFVNMVSNLLAFLMCFSLSQNISFMEYKKEDLWQYQYADIIAESGIENPKMINVGCFDAGLYTVAGIVPTCRYYQTQTIHLDDIEDVQFAYMKSGDADFILTRDYGLEGLDGLYECIEETPWQQSGYDFTYRLYRKTEGGE